MRFLNFRPRYINHMRLIRNALTLFFFATQAQAALNVEPVVIRTLTEVTGGGLSVSGSTVTATGSYDLISMSIAVSSGSGYVVFSGTGTMVQCAFKPPVSNAVFTFEIVTDDEDAFPVAGREDMIGKSSLAFNRFVFGSHKASVSNASEDGNYRIRCVLK